jgi:hypothetical protein
VGRGPKTYRTPAAKAFLSQFFFKTTFGISFSQSNLMTGFSINMDSLPLLHAPNYGVHSLPNIPTTPQFASADILTQLYSLLTRRYRTLGILAKTSSHCTVPVGGGGASLHLPILRLRGYYFCMMIEGSGPISVSVQINYGSGSGSRRPKNSGSGTEIRI